MPGIAVTGASGFIGRRLIEQLFRDGVPVRALMRKPPASADHDNVTIIEGALGDDRAISALIDGIDAVVHLAGLIKARTPTAFFETNTRGTEHLAKAIAAAQNPPKLVLVSSLAAREPEISSYAASKRKAEEVLATLDTAVPWTILRPPAVYGPGDRETLSFFKGIARGVGAMLGDNKARFSLLHVDDLIGAIRSVLDPKIANRLTLEPDDGMEGGHSWASMIDTAERSFNKKALRVRVPATVLAALGHLNAGLRILPGYTPMLTPEKVREITHPNWVADRRSILSATNWRPAVPVDSGFPATIAWYRQHRWL